MQHFFNENRKCAFGGEGRGREGRGRALHMRGQGLHRARGRHPLQRGAKHLQGVPFPPLQLQLVRIHSQLQQGRVKYVALVNGESYEAQEGG